MARQKKEDVFPLIKGVLEGQISKEDFCELTNLKLSSYQYWLRRYQNEVMSSGSFVRVKTNKVRDLPSSVEISINPDITIRFSQLVPPDYLLKLIEQK